MRRLTAALTASAVLVLGYAGLDAADFVPGLLTTRPLPPPPPTETPGTRTLPVVPQPSASTSVRMPLGSLAGESAAPSAAGVRRALAQVLDLPALSDAALVVRDGQSGQVLFDQGGTERRIPASTTKLLAAAAVGQVFTPDETLKTQVRQGSSANEIVLVPGGDTLIAPGAGDRDAVAGRAGLADLANQVVKALKDSGIDEVTLSLDTSYAPGPTHAPTWGADFHRLGIVGAVTMLGLSTERAAENHPAPNDPVASTVDTLAALLEKRGISVTTTATGTASPSQRVLGSVESAPVRDQLALALTDSDNTLTEVLARQAAFRRRVGHRLQGRRRLGRGAGRGAGDRHGRRGAVRRERSLQGEPRHGPTC